MNLVLLNKILLLILLRSIVYYACLRIRDLLLNKFGTTTSVGWFSSGTDRGAGNGGRVKFYVFYRSPLSRVRILFGVILAHNIVERIDYVYIKLPIFLTVG